MAWIDLPTQTRLQIEAYARTHMGVEPGHDYGHVRRVANWAVRLAHEEDTPDPLSLKPQASSMMSTA